MPVFVDNPISVKVGLDRGDHVDNSHLLLYPGGGGAGMIVVTTTWTATVVLEQFIANQIGDTVSVPSQHLGAHWVPAPSRRWGHLSKRLLTLFGSATAQFVSLNQNVILLPDREGTRMVVVPCTPVTRGPTSGELHPSRVLELKKNVGKTVSHSDES